MGYKTLQKKINREKERIKPFIFSHGGTNASGNFLAHKQLRYFYNPQKDCVIIIEWRQRLKWP